MISISYNHIKLCTIEMINIKDLINLFFNFYIMPKEKDTLNDVTQKSENFSDKIVGMFYSESFVKKIESLDFMKSLIESSFIKGINDFWKGWFIKVFVFLGYLSVIFWVIGFLMDLKMLFGTFRYFNSSITVILWMVFSFLAVIWGIWMIKFKKRYPFVVLITFIYQIIYTICLNFFFSTMYYYSWWMWIWSMIISAVLFVIWYAILLKNKDLFKN